MELLKLKITEFKQNEDNYNEYKSKVQKIKELLKENKKCQCIYESFNSLNNNNLYLYFLFFQNYEKWININFENNNIDENINKFISIMKCLEKNSFNNKCGKKINIYFLFVHWLFYLYNEFIQNFYSVLNPKYSEADKIRDIFNETNKIRYIFNETNIILVKLYKVNILNTNQIFNLMNFSIFLIETNFEIKSYSDKLYKGKNQLLLKGLFFLLQESSTIIINKVNLNEFGNENENKTYIQKIFLFLDEFQKNKIINHQLNIMVLINNNIIHSYMNILLDKINIKIISKYEPKFQKKLLDFFSHFFKFNYRKSKIFNTFLNSLKESFINLYNFENNKDKILHDLFINNFYTKLLKKIFYKAEISDNSISRPLFDSFFFNGFDSQISLNVQNNNFEKATMFFSFYLTPLEGRKLYPLFLIQKDFDGKKNDLISIFLKKKEEKIDENNSEEEFYLCLSLEGKEKQLDNLPIIKSKTTYYFSLCFNINKLLISFCNKKEEIFCTEIDKYNKLLAITSISLSFGFYKKRVNVFSGYIGPIIMVKYPKNFKEINEFISSVLKLESNYNNFIFLLKNSNFFFEREFYCQINMNNKFDYKLEKIECLLYIIPEKFCFFNCKSSMLNHIPKIDSICKIQREYNVYNLNTTLIRHEQGIINFIMDNGLDYICLLYEYIYQFIENYLIEEVKENNPYQDDKDIFMKIITSIFKKTLFILEKNYSEIMIPNFNKNLKQIYMNLFYCLKLINRKASIIDSLINYFFGIIKYYHKYISNFINNKNFDSDCSDVNKNIFKTNLSCINGWIDFLLSPEIYNYDSKKSLIKLFNELSLYFNYIRINNVSEKINQNLYNKLLNFIPFLNTFYDDQNNDNDKNKANNIHKINSNENENDIFFCFFKSLKCFFENNPSKSENIINLKNIFIFVNDYLSQNSHVFYKFYDFINNLIGSNSNIYFNEEKDNEQILLFIKYANKFLKNNNDNQKIKNENEVENKSNLFNKLLSILTRIIFSKKRLGKNDTIISKFHKLILKVNKTNDLMITVSNEIINLLNNILSVPNNFDNKNIENKNQKEIVCKIYTSEELKNLSNFYFQIFDIISYFLECPVDNNNKENNNMIDNENIIIQLLIQITNILKLNIEDSNKMDNNDWVVINLDENSNYLDIIYIIINFLKFYHSNLFRRLVSQNIIQNFVDVCELCCKTSLIYSNILIEVDEELNITKTPIEIILDICIFYINLSSTKFSENSFEKDINKDVIVEEQKIINNLLNNILIKSNNKDKKHSYTIFFINDCFRLLSYNYPIDGKKRPKSEDIFTNFQKDFNNYQNLERALLKEEIYNFNFSTFFILKATGYKKILIELCLKISDKNIESNDLLKCNDILNLIISVIQKNYSEHEILYSKNKNFFFKKANISFCHYNEIKKKIEYYIKQKNFSEIDTYIQTVIFNKNFENLYNTIYSGCCKNKKSMEHKYSEFDKFEPKEKKEFRHALSSTNLIKELNQSKGLENNLSFTNMSKKSLTKSLSLGRKASNSPSEKESSNSQDELDFELKVEEITSSENTKYDKLSESLKIEDNLKYTYSTPQLNDFKKYEQRKQTFNSNFSLSEYNDLSPKNKKDFRLFSNFSDISTDSSNSNNGPTYINYFNEPDECYMNNAKKELMMTIFSIYFFDAFFINDNFKIIKDYYTQNFEGVQKSTKLLDYPSKIKIFSNTLEPFLFLKPYSSFYISKIFPITHQYFKDYMKKNNIKEYEPIILYKKSLPEFNLEEKFDKKCELIKIKRGYYGHIVGSKNVNYIIFEQKKYEFYEILSDSKNINKILNINEQIKPDLNDLFTLTYLYKKPHNNKGKTKEINEKRKKYKTEKKIIILFEEIEEILERRFLLMWQAIEIYLKNGKSYFFNFLSKDQTKFILDIFKKNKITKDKVHEKDFFKIHQSNLMTEWQEERLSTYEYLLFLNKYGSRTFNDVNQYPVFPWLVRKYILDNDNKNFNMLLRDFKYPMAAQTEDKRNYVLSRFEDDEQNKIKFPVHYGIHYSTSSYIFFYLMREEPFTTLLIKLQGYKHESPDRMFFSIADTLFVMDEGKENRECIPDLFCKTEQFLNLNCADFGKKNCGRRVDDLNLCLNEDDYTNNIFFEMHHYVNFIIENKKLLDGSIISSSINDWIDIIFGIGQLPSNNMKKCLNIFNKESYEQKTNLHEKLLSLQKKNKQQDDIIKKIYNKIDLIISFGQTPYQLFNEKHPVKDKRKNKKIDIENNEENEEDFESQVTNIIWEKSIKGNTETLPIFFEINQSIGKIFFINKNRKLEIIDSNYYNIIENQKKHFNFSKLGILELSHIKFFEKIEIQDNSNYFYYIINPKYSFSSFKGNDNNSYNNNEYISYYNSYINNLGKQKSKKGKTNIDEYIRFVTCRYVDNSFKIHCILKNKIKKDDKPYSFICEDFVTSCCTLDNNKFLIGLKNGKLIQWCYYKDNNNIDKIKFDRQIQAHSNSINVIEVNSRLGIIITAGEDNYVFIRKLYDFELITPIKIKSKYIITMAKVSPMNFLYIMCFNKTNGKNKSVIFGYTLNGLYFAKSKYDYFDSIDFTKNGNIVTFAGKKEIEILSGDTLSNIILNTDDKIMKEVQTKISGASWIKFKYFSRKYEIEHIIYKIITYSIFDKTRNGNFIETLDVTKIKYFE